MDLQSLEPASSSVGEYFWSEPMMLKLEMVWGGQDTNGTNWAVDDTASL